MSELNNPFQAPEAPLTSEQMVNHSIEMVSGGRRFLHYLADIVVIQLLKFVIAILLVLAMGPKNPLITNPLLGFVYGIGMWMTYYLVMEVNFQKTIGKMLTGTVVVTEDGGIPTIGQYVKRTFSRLVPFEPFSCFGEKSRGWHDDWSGTYVVRVSKL